MKHIDEMRFLARLSDDRTTVKKVPESLVAQLEDLEAFLGLLSEGVLFVERATKSKMRGYGKTSSGKVIPHSKHLGMHKHAFKPNGEAAAHKAVTQHGKKHGWSKQDHADAANHIHKLANKAYAKAGNLKPQHPSAKKLVHHAHTLDTHWKAHHQAAHGSHPDD